jgi:hypothetical protein
LQYIHNTVWAHWMFYHLIKENNSGYGSLWLHSRTQFYLDLWDLVPTQAITLSKQYSYPSNPQVHVSQTMVIVTANIKVQVIMNLRPLTTAVYRWSWTYVLWQQRCIKMTYFCKKHEDIHEWCEQDYIKLN